MDSSITIPISLVLRSLPINVEMIELIKQKRLKENPSQIEPITQLNRSTIPNFAG
jgi:hypothetical protein